MPSYSADKEEPIVHKSSLNDRYEARPPSTAYPEFGLNGIDVNAEEDVDPERKLGAVKRMRKKVYRQIRKKHACERACMCALAVSLLWITSLVVCQEVTHAFISTPTQTSVVESYERLSSVTLSQRSAYKTCATEAATDCRTAYTRDTDAEDERVLTVQNTLAARLQTIKAEVLACSIAFLNATDWLNEAVSNGNIQTITINSTDGICGTTDFTTFLNSSSISAQSISDLQDYQNSADATIDSLNSALNERDSYMSSYLSNTTSGTFTEITDELLANLTTADDVYDKVDTYYASFMACMSLTSSYTTDSGTTVSCGDSIFAAAVSQFEEYENQYESLLDEAKAFRTEIETKMANYEALYEKVTSALSISGLSGLYVSGISLDFDDVLEQYMTSAYSSLSNLLDGPEEIYSDLLTQANDFMTNIESAVQSVTDGNDEVESNATYLTTYFFDDYDPPAIDETLYDEQVDSSSSVVSSVTDSLDSVTTETNGTSSIEDYVSSTALNISEEAANLLDKATPRTWESFFTYPSSVFNQFSSGITSVSSLALAFDYAYRVIRSLMLIKKYWNISAINTPPADVRTKAGIEAGVFVAKTNMVQKAGKILTHPGLHIFLILLWLALFSAAFYSAYSPIYEEYVNGCVDKCYYQITNTITNTDGTYRYNATLEGTMLYRNAFAIADQYAFANGDYVASTEVDSLGVEMELACSDAVTETIQVQLEQDDQFEYYNDRALDYIDSFEYLRQCVDTEALNTNYPQSYDFDPLVYDASLAECVRSFDDLDTYLDSITLDVTSKDRNFDCDNIDTCDFGCSGPSEAILRGVSFDSACTIEWYGHAELLTVLCAIFGYITINIARIVFLDGIVKVFWRHFSAHYFAIIASCREDGAIIYPEEVTEEGKSFRHVIVMQLRIAIRAFERRGCLLTLFGIALIIPWFAILISLNRHLAFDSDKICNL